MDICQYINFILNSTRLKICLLARWRRNMSRCERGSWGRREENPVWWGRGRALPSWEKAESWEREIFEDRTNEIMQNQEEELHFFKHLSILLGVFANFGQGNL